MERRPKAYRVIEDTVIPGGGDELIVKGSIVFECLQCDYGLARDDSRALGYRHLAVTLEPNGDYPFFTIAVSRIELIGGHDLN